MIELGLLLLMGLFGVVLLGGLLAIGLALIKAVAFLIVLPFKLLGALLGVVGALVGLVVMVVLVAAGLPLLLLVLGGVLVLLVVAGLPLLLLACVAGAVCG